MTLRRFAPAVVAAALLSGCYHATIETGKPASSTTISKPWAHGFVYGLVPPSAVETASRCPNGVARVETRLSFLNQLASALTFGLYSPMQIDVTCASGASASAVLDGASNPAKSIEQAAERSRVTGAPVDVKLR